MIELAIASAFISARGYQQAGRAARMEGALTARNIKEQAKIRRLQALQEHNDIMANLQTFKSQNAAVAGTTGRDMGSDRSYKALLKNAEQNTKTLAQRSNYQKQNLQHLEIDQLVWLPLTLVQCNLAMQLQI